MPRALEMTLLLEHPVYDCVYLAMAERDGDRLISAEARFLSKVDQSSLARFAEHLS